MRLTAHLVAALCWLAPLPALAQEAAAIVAQNRDQIEKPSRQTIGPVIAELAASGDPMADDILSAWAEKRLVIRKSDDVLFLATPEGDGFALTALDGTPAGTALLADIIAGDYLYIKRYLPERLDGKTIITNTTTAEDVAMLRERGAALMVSTTPELEGRSFGTNVMEGVLLALSGKRPEEMTPQDYLTALESLGWQPNVVRLQG